MRSHVHFILIFLYLRLLFADCWPEDDSYNSTSTYIQTDTLYLRKPNKPACPSNRCLRKCCKANEIYNWESNTCLPDLDNELKKANWTAHSSQYDVIYDSRCPNTSAIMERHDYQLSSNGSIYWFGWGIVNFHEYCLDYITSNGEIVPIYCAHEDVWLDTLEQPFPLRYYLNLSGSIISVSFLAITLGLYLVAPGLRKNVHDKCVMCHLLSLLIGFSFLLGIQFEKPHNPECIFIGRMTQFWLLASFFWLNIMCIDMWRTVGSMSSFMESGVKKLLIYCLYAMGCPSCILIGSLLADKFSLPDSPLRTGFGEETCWFKRINENNRWLDPRYLHYYSFVSITMIINVYTFAATALTIKSQHQRWNVADGTDGRRHMKCHTIITLYLKMFIVMGLYWLMDVLSYHVYSQNMFWTIVDFITTLQGFFIFIIFICNKRALKILSKRFRLRKNNSKQSIPLNNVQITKST